MRGIYSFFAGGLFGVGLLVSGMNDTRKVQGWLDVFGDWDPTLAFVLGGAIIPMAIAWHLARTRTPVLGGAFPDRTDQPVRWPLVSGSFLFGFGWGLVGLCPGPSMASLSYGGQEGVIFLVAMVAGMLATPPLRRRFLEKPTPA